MKKLVLVAGITAAALLTTGAASAGTMTDTEFFANINELAYDDQNLETVEFARMEFGAVESGNHSPYSTPQTWNSEFNPASGPPATSGRDPWVSIIHAPLYIDTY